MDRADVGAGAQLARAGTLFSLLATSPIAPAFWCVLLGYLILQVSPVLMRRMCGSWDADLAAVRSRDLRNGRDAASPQSSIVPPRPTRRAGSPSRRSGVDRAAPRAGAPDPNRLDTYRARVQDLAERVMDGVAGWPATDALGADVRALAGAAVTFVAATDHEQLPELDSTLRSASNGALDVVRAVDAAAAGLQDLSTAVAGVDPTGPTTDRTVRLRRALVGAAHELRGLGVATRALADARSHREEWTEATARVADDLTDALAEVIERVGQAGVADADAAPENPADSTKDLGADLGRLATRESRQALQFGQPRSCSCWRSPASPGRCCGAPHWTPPPSCAISRSWPARYAGPSRRLSAEAGYAAPGVRRPTRGAEDPAPPRRPLLRRQREV